MFLCIFSVRGNRAYISVEIVPFCRGDCLFSAAETVSE